MPAGHAVTFEQAVHGARPVELHVLPFTQGGEHEELAVFHA